MDTNGTEKQGTVREDYTVESSRLYFNRIEMMVAVTDILSRIALPGVLLLTLTKVIPYFSSVPDNVYYAVFLALFIWLVLRGGLKISYTYIPFLVALFISIWVNEIPAYFKVWFRGLAFLSVVCVSGYPVDCGHFIFWVGIQVAFCTWIQWVSWIDKSIYAARSVSGDFDGI